MRAFFDLLSGFQASPTPTAERQRHDFGNLIDDLIGLYQEAISDDVGQDLIKVLQTLAENGDAIQKAIIVWIDLIEELIQDEEERYGSETGLGVLKANDLKAVIRYLLLRFVDIKKVPRFIEQIIIDIGVDWTVNALIAVLNADYDIPADRTFQQKYVLKSAGKTRSLMIVRDTRPTSFYARLQILLHKTLKLLGRVLGLIWNIIEPLWRPVGRFLIFIWNKWIYRRPILSQRLRTVLEAVEERGLIVNSRQLLRGATDAFAWLGSHGDQVKAGVKLVFRVVEETEKLTHLTGREKKEYARAAVWAFLDKLGYSFGLHSGLLYAIVNAVIDGLIDAAVRLFNKHEHFETS